MQVFIDTHTHLYLEEFANDRAQAINTALNNGVKQMLLPNVDEQTLQPMLALCELFPDVCRPMIGLHPTSVKPDFEDVLQRMKPLLDNPGVVAVGETGIDLYWDKTYFAQQVISFETQIAWALQYNLPLVIHSRNSVVEIMKVLNKYRDKGLKGVMHCFPGDAEQAQWFTDLGFMLGIGGVVTYKNSLMAKVVEAIDLRHIILETDAPYLPPVPYRGKRNEPAYIPIIAAKIAEIKGIPSVQVAEQTTENANHLFQLKLT